MKILKLKIDNVGGIEAFELAPDGNHVVIGGPNTAGKSTILNAIAGALGGGRNRKAQRVRKGAAKGEVVVDLGDIVVKWGPKVDGKDSLEVTTAEGDVKKKPQELLDRLWGERTFDPFAWFEAEPREQARQLAEIAGIDLDALEARRKVAFDERTAVNRMAKELAAQAADPAYATPDGTPDEPVDEKALATEVHDAAKLNAENAERRAELRRLEGLLETHRAGVETIRRMGVEAISEAKTIGAERVTIALDALRRAQEAVEEAKRAAVELVATVTRKAATQSEAVVEQVARMERQVAESVAVVSGLADVDVAAVSDQLAEARNVNHEVEMKRSRSRLVAAAEAHRGKAASLTATIATVDEEKAAALAAASLPVDGLGLEDGAVTYQGTLLESISRSEQLRISVALGLARHPEIAVMLIDRWGDLDDPARKIVTEMADAANCQIWTTVVGEKDEDITVTIREGLIAQERIKNDKQPNFEEFDD